jgi:hypothetical protein
LRLVCQHAGYIDDVSFLQKSPWLLFDAFLKLDRQAAKWKRYCHHQAFAAPTSKVKHLPSSRFHAHLCTHTSPFTLRFIFISLETDNQSRDRNGRSRLSFAIGHAVAQRELQSPAPCSTLLNRCSGTAKHKTLPPPALHSTHHHSPSFNAKIHSTQPSPNLTSKWSTARSNLFHSTTSSKLVCMHAPHRLKHAANNIQGRKQRRHEQLAQDIFGKNRRQSAPAAGNIRNAPLGGSLASRVGVNKVCSIQ